MKLSSSFWAFGTPICERPFHISGKYLGFKEEHIIPIPMEDSCFGEGIKR